MKNILKEHGMEILSLVLFLALGIMIGLGYAARELYPNPETVYLSPPAPLAHPIFTLEIYGKQK